VIAPTLLFWAFAFVDMVVAVSCATTAVLRVRRGDVEGHVRMMVTAQLAIGVFLAAYLAKVVLVGRGSHEVGRPSAAHLGCGSPSRGCSVAGWSQRASAESAARRRR
jgi:hypothetical protein